MVGLAADDSPDGPDARALPAAAASSAHTSTMTRRVIDDDPKNDEAPKNDNPENDEIRETQAALQGHCRTRLLTRVRAINHCIDNT